MGTIIKSFVQHPILNYHTDLLLSSNKPVLQRQLSNNSHYYTNLNQLRLITTQKQNEIQNEDTIDNKTSLIRFSKTSNQRNCVLAAGLNGSINLILPVDEKIFKRLHLLQYMMSMILSTICGLNPKDYRLYKSILNYRLERKKGVLDSVLLWKFVTLEAIIQDDLAAAMGTTVEIILENLSELDLSYQFF